MDVVENEAGLAPQQSVQLDIIIVGAGIIGLAAAAALSRVGHKITVSRLCKNYRRMLS